MSGTNVFGETVGPGDWVSWQVPCLRLPPAYPPTDPQAKLVPESQTRLGRVFHCNEDAVLVEPLGTEPGPLWLSGQQWRVALTPAGASK